MKSNHTKQIINEIAEEEGLDERSIELIVSSQFEAINKIISSAIADNEKSFKSIRINAFGIFKFMPNKLKRSIGRKEYLKINRNLYDSKK
jgi:nucleoid DNA-binding protein